MSKALEIQVGGDHYKGMKIQPMEYSMANGLDACQHTAIKYISRFRDKGGIQDLEKAKHVIDLLIDFELKRVAEDDAPGSPSFGERLIAACEEVNVQMAEERASLPISWTDVHTPRAPFHLGEKLELLTVANAVEIVHYEPTLSFKGIIAWRPARPARATHWHIGWGCWIAKDDAQATPWLARWRNIKGDWEPLALERFTAIWYEQLRPM